ncbi:MAG: hypothetical protein ACRDQ1_03535, partial [Sciscionella sp.]
MPLGGLPCCSPAEVVVRLRPETRYWIRSVIRGLLYTLGSVVGGVLLVFAAASMAPGTAAADAPIADIGGPGGGGGPAPDSGPGGGGGPAPDSGPGGGGGPAPDSG